MTRYINLFFILLCLNITAQSIPPQNSKGGKRILLRDKTPPSPQPEKLPKDLSLLIIGDSNTEKGHVVGGLMKLFEEKYGYFGTGYRGLGGQISKKDKKFRFCGNGDAMAYQPWFWLSSTGTWKTNYNSKLAPDNSHCETSEAGATIKIEFYGNRLYIYYLTDKDLGEFSIEVDGKQLKTIAQKGDFGVGQYVIKGLSNQWHTVELKAESGQVKLLGVDARVELNGKLPSKSAVVHKWGRSSSATSHHIAISPVVYQQALKLIQPANVMLMLGTNDHNMFGYGSAMVMNNTAKLVERIRRALPESNIIISSTLWSRGTPDRAWVLDNYLEDWPNLAQALGVNYWNLYGLMKDAPMKFVFPKEKIHFSPSGGDLVAEALHKELLSIKKINHSPEALTLKNKGVKPEKKLSHIGGWYAADGPMLLDKNGRVAQINNMVNHPKAPRNFRQMFPEKRPELMGKAANGKPAFSFNGKNQYFVSDNIGFKSLIVVCKANKPGGALFGEGRKYYRRYGPGKPGSEFMFVKKQHHKANFFVNGKKMDPTKIKYPVGKWIILSLEGLAHGNVRTIGQNDYWKGGKTPKDGAERSYWDGQIAEIIFRSNINFGEKTRKSLESYLAKKYGITLEQDDAQ